MIPPPRWTATAATLTYPTLLAALLACSDNGPPEPTPVQVAQGQQTFRFDTFGDETFWTDTLRIHEVIQGGVSPVAALAVGLKVDADVLPPGILQTADLNSPATTVALLKLNAVVGLKGTVEMVNGKDSLTRVGITCALCHSTVNNSAAPASAEGRPHRVSEIPLSTLAG